MLSKPILPTDIVVKAAFFKGSNGIKNKTDRK